MGYYVGIDLGTSSVKLVLLDEVGTVCATASHAYRLHCPQEGWSEADPNEWWDAVIKGLEDLIAQCGASEIRALGVTGQMHTVALVDKNGRALRPAMMWNDTRTSALIGDLRKRLAQAGESYNADIVSTGSPASNLSWLACHEPEVLSQAEAFLIGPDWIVYQLTGMVGTDACEASTSALFDFDTNSWSPAAFEALGLPLELAPPIRGSAEVVGTLRPSLARQLGLAEDVAVVAGTGDNAATALALGCFTSSAKAVSLGTSAVVMGATDTSATADQKGKLVRFSLDGRQFQTLLQGAVQSCGNTHRWWAHDILGRPFPEQASPAYDPERLGENHVLFYPHVMGEKTLYADSELRGAFVGLDLRTTADDLVLAVMEGMAFGLREIRDAWQWQDGCTDGFRVVGGGSQSDVWMQVLADVMGVPTLRLAESASAGYGAALLARASCCGFDSLRGNASKIERTFIPHPTRIERYNQAYERYRRLHDAMVFVREGAPLPKN